MHRTREVAASPAKSASETWGAIKTLIGDSLSAAEAIDDALVAGTLAKAGPVMLMLISGRHLIGCPLTMVAGDASCDIYAVHGDKALRLEESLSPLPGLREASTFAVYLPAPYPLTASIETAARTDDHLFAGEAPKTSVRARTRAGVVDLSAIRENR